MVGDGSTCAHPGLPTTLMGSGGNGACFGGEPTATTMSEYVSAVMTQDAGNTDGPVDGGLGRGVPYTFGRTGKALYEHMQFELADIPHHLQGAPSCEHSDVQECVEDALDEDPERDLAWERIQCPPFVGVYLHTRVTVWGCTRVVPCAWSGCACECASVCQRQSTAGAWRDTHHPSEGS